MYSVLVIAVQLQEHVLFFVLTKMGSFFLSVMLVKVTLKTAVKYLNFFHFCPLSCAPQLDVVCR